MRLPLSLFAFFMFLVAIPGVFGQQAEPLQGVFVSSYTVQLEMDPKAATVHETVDIFFTATADLIHVAITPQATNLHVLLDGAPVGCSLAEEQGTTRLTCPLNQEARKRFLTVTYDTKYSLLSLNGKQLMIRYRYTPLYRADKTDISVTLPSGYVIEDTSRFIVPEPTTIYSDGQRIIVGWERSSLIEPFGISIVTSPLATGNSMIWYGVIAVALAAIATFLVFAYKTTLSKEIPGHLKTAGTHEHNPLRELVYPDLLESEEKVVESLKANLGVLKQKDLVNMTGFSKAKMSRLLKQMESRNLVRSKPYGNSRKIFLVTEREKQQMQKTVADKAQQTKPDSISVAKTGNEPTDR